MVFSASMSFQSVFHIAVYSDSRFATFKIPSIQENQYSITLEKETLNLSEDYSLTIIKFKEKWHYRSKKEKMRIMTEGSYSYTVTDAGEELLILILSTKGLIPCERLNLNIYETVLIGNDYQNAVFYESNALVASTHARMTRTGNSFEIEAMTSNYIYVNQIRVKEKAVLKPGDNIQIYGLTLVFLGEILACCALCGIVRTSKGKEELPAADYKEVTPSTEYYFVPRAVREEKELYQGEVEIKAPPVKREWKAPPFLLTAGPSLTMIFPIWFSSLLMERNTQSQSAGFYSMTLTMTVCTAFFSLFWSITNHLYRCRKGKKEEAARISKYRNYLRETENFIISRQESNTYILSEQYPHGKRYTDFFRQEKAGCFIRNSVQEDFLFFRLGIGGRLSPIQIKVSSGDREDFLFKEAVNLAEKYRNLENVPAGIDLRQERIQGYAGNAGFSGIHGNLLQFLIQIAATQSSAEVKIVYFYHKNKFYERRLAECVKWLPHIFAGSGKIRFLAGNEEETGEILPYLTNELTKRLNQGHNSDISSNRPWYIFIIANESLIQGEILYNYLTREIKECGTSVVFLQEKREMLPDSCMGMVLHTKEFEGIQKWTGKHYGMQKINFDTGKVEEAEAFMRHLSIYETAETIKNELPDRVSFLDLFQCRRVEELDSTARYKTNKAGKRLKVPIGFSAGNKLLYLDIHEKFHGPHGLIAGTTGSGKSELLQTYLLALAVCYSPDCMNFFIIDYKGGGMGNHLSNLPHCAGVISNLSGKQIKRAMSAIKSENNKRQKQLAVQGINHIDKYEKLFEQGSVKLPMPHLLIVIDEFAELKKEEPDVMKEIISVAQVGRSLGVHLLLATQKPSGTVDDRIWSNTRFRLCLRVQEKQDSMDMLHRPEAASLTAVGQGYLQVGNNELYELFQAAYSGEEYRTDSSGERAWMLSDTGRRITAGVENKSETEGYESQMEAVSLYLEQVVKNEGYQRAKPLWMEELPTVILLEELEDKNAGIQAAKLNEYEENSEVIIRLGICDDPENQRQFLISYNPVKEGHLALCGGVSTGKSTFIQTFLWQLCLRYNVKQAQFALIDLRGRGLLCFKGMPQCYGALHKKEEAERFFYHIEKSMSDRKKLFGGGSYEQYCLKGKELLPLLFIVIDDYGEFRRETGDYYDAFMEKLAGDGLRLGIFLLITAMGPGNGEIQGKLYEKIKCTAALEMSDKFKYGDILRQYQIPVWPSENVKGRGILKYEERILEFQTALAFQAENDYERMTRIEKTANEMYQRIKNAKGYLPEIIPMLKEHFTYKEFIEEYQFSVQFHMLPLGYNSKTGERYCLDFKQNTKFLISGEEGTGKKNLLKCMIKSMTAMGIKVLIYESGKDRGIWQDIKGTQIIAEKAKWAGLLNCTDKAEQETCLCISDMAAFCSEDFVEQRTDIRINAPFIIAIHNPLQIKETAGIAFFEKFVLEQKGIHLGGNAGGQINLHFDDLPYSLLSKPMPLGAGYLKNGINTDTIQLLLPKYESRSRKEGYDSC